jgi:hypothetical protein
MIPEETREPIRDPHHAIRRAIAAHFSAAGRPSDEQALRAHLPSCVACHRIYERHLLLAKLDPAAVPAQDRLARGLGLARVRPRAGGRAAFGWATLAGAAVAAAITLLATPGPTSPAGGFASRGLPVTALPELLVYRIAAGSGASEPATDRVRAGDELAFAYRNPGGKRHLLVFAIDEHRHVYWYHPEWSRPADDPRAVSLSVEPALHELPAAVIQRFDGDELTIHALFTDREMTVRQVEGAFAAAAGHGVGSAVEFPDATDVIHTLKIAR